MHYHRITLLLLIFFISCGLVLHQVGYTSPVATGLGELLRVVRPSAGRIEGLMVMQEEVLGGMLKVLLEDKDKGKGKDRVKRKEIPRILHRIWLDPDGGLEHVSEEKEEGKKKGGKNKREEKKGSGGTVKVEKVAQGPSWKVIGGDGIEHIPKEWAEKRKTCKEINKGWKEMFWTSQKALDFISTHFPEFLQTYVAYTDNGKRAQALQYLVLWRYGGVVLDWGVKCEREMDGLGGLGLWVGSREGGDGFGSAGGKWVDTSVMGAVEGHGFLQMMREEMQRKGEGWLNHKSIRLGLGMGLGAEGRLFEDVWERYHRKLNKELALGTWDVNGTMAGAMQITHTQLESEKGNDAMEVVDGIGWRIILLGTGGSPVFWNTPISASASETKQHPMSPEKNPAESPSKQPPNALSNPQEQPQPQSPLHYWKIAPRDRLVIMVLMAICVALFWIFICASCLGWRGFGNAYAERRGRPRFRMRNGVVPVVRGTGAYLGMGAMNSGGGLLGEGGKEF